MPADIFIRDGLEIRRLKSGRCVLEDEWQQFTAINKVLRVPYMLENEPFEKLLSAYSPVPKFNHHPPRMRFGFAIPNPFAEFRRVALKYNLGDPEEISTTEDYRSLRTRVLSHLNKWCDLPPGRVVAFQYIHSKESHLVIELATNYRERIPRKKLDDVLCGIREVFSLPEDTKPKWYLEVGIAEKDPKQYCIPMSTFAWSPCDQN